MRAQALIILLLALTTLAAYWQAPANDFTNFDDNYYVTDNPHVQAGMNGESVIWAFTSTHAGNWHPLTWISHMLDCQLYDMNPKGHHVTSLLFHLANVLLLFWVLVRLTGSIWRSAFVAALFAVHPLHVESVAWVAERKDVLSTLFWLLTMLVYVRYAQQPKLTRYLPVILLFALGLMAKPMLVTLPFVLLLLDYWPLRRFGSQNDKRRGKAWAGWKLIWEKTPLLVLVAASSVVTYIVQEKSGFVRPTDEFPFGARVSNAVVSYAAFIGKMLLPRNLAVFYPYPVKGLPIWEVVGAAALLVAVSALVIRAGRRRPYLPVGWLWYLGTLVPVIGLVQVGVQAMADRYTYVPLIGLFIIIAWGVPDLFGREADRSRSRGRRSATEQSRSKILVVLAAMVIAILMVCTWFQVGYWRSNIALFRHALACTTENDIAHNNLAIALAGEGKLDEAIEHYKTALRIKPDKAKAHYNLANVLTDRGKLDEAIRHYEEAIRIDDRYAKAYHNLGLALARQGKLDEAAACFEKALRIDPQMLDARLNLGALFGKLGRTDEAIREYKEVVRLKPSAAEAHEGLATGFALKGDYAEAWKEVHLCQKYGLSPNASMVDFLSEKIPDPRE